MRFRLEVMDVGTQKCGQTSLTHVLTHTGLARSGLGRLQWIHGVAKLWEKAQKWQLLADKVMSTAAHNPEVVGSSPASTTIKAPDFDKKSGAFLTFKRKMERPKMP